MSEQPIQAFQVRIPYDLHQKARIKSIKTGKSLNEIINEKLQEWVDEGEKQSTPKKATRTTA